MHTLEFFVNPADAPRCKHVIDRMNKLRLPVLELDAPSMREMNGHSVAFVPISQSMRRTGRHTHLQEVYVRYAGAPSTRTGPAGACSGIIEVSVWEMGRAARLELARRAKERRGPRADGK